MKFGVQLRLHQTPEWRSQYLNYDRLKTALENYTKNQQLDRSTIKKKYVEQAREKFIHEFIDHEINSEVDKIELFYINQVTKNEALWQDISYKAKNLFEVQIDHVEDDFGFYEKLWFLLLINIH